MSRLRANRHRWFGAAAFLALVVTMLFLITPIVAILTNTSPRTLIDALGESANREALWLSLKTTTAAMVIIIVVGTPAAYFLALRSFRGRSVVLTLIELPLVMPPTVAGIALLAAFGPSGLFGQAIEDAGVELVFQTAGVVVALVFVASPFYLRQAIADLNMLVMLGGRERTILEFRQLLEAAGFRYVGVTPAALGYSVVEGVAA